MIYSKPLLIQFGQVASLLGGGGSLLVALSALLGEEGQVIFGEEVTHAEFAWRFVPAFLILGIHLLVISYGFWREQVWSRQVAVGFAPVNYLCGLWLVQGQLLLFQIVGLGAVLVFSIWYFYFKKTVVWYYAQIPRR